jgi:hypothetical protein
MKKFFTVLIGLFLIISLASCDKDSNPISSSNNQTVIYQKDGIFDSLVCNSNSQQYYHLIHLGKLNFDTLQYKIEFTYKSSIRNGNCFYGVSSHILTNLVNGGWNEYTHDSTYHPYQKEFQGIVLNDSCEFIQSAQTTNYQNPVKGYIVVRNLKIFKK